MEKCNIEEIYCKIKHTLSGTPKIKKYNEKLPCHKKHIRGMRILRKYKVLLTEYDSFSKKNRRSGLKKMGTENPTLSNKYRLELFVLNTSLKT